MSSLPPNRTKTAPARVALLFWVFFLIAFGLGYPTLNRFDPRQTPGLSDVKTYAALVTGDTSFDAADMRFRRFRVLVPWLARPFYLLARGRLASWDPVMFGLLVADSLFVAGTAILIVLLGGILSAQQKSSTQIGLLGALLYLVNFAVPNLRLVGLVDAGEGFFLLMLLWSLVESRLWALPMIGVLGALTKESYIPLSIAFTAAWWLSWRMDSHGETDRPHLSREASSILASWALSIAAMVALQWSILGSLTGPVQFGLALHRGGGYSLVSSLQDRNLCYIFLWLLPTAIPNLKRLPKTWLLPLAADCAMALILDAYFGPAPGTMGRSLFSIAGPLLSLSSAIFLLRIATPSEMASG